MFDLIQAATNSGNSSDGPKPKPGGNAGWALHAIQLLFLLVALPSLNGPFVSAHNERQNQTFDVARRVFHEGWHALLAPKASFSLPGHEEQPFASMQLEFPFHGLFGWPLELVTGHERAVVRLVSLFFALASIQLLYALLRFWVRPAAAASGAGLWAFAPLVLHFGQVPMPDILSVTGMLAAFYFALKGNLPASSGSFLFSALAKSSIIVFGLPILAALLVAKGCRSVRDFSRLSLLWGFVPLLGLLSWILWLYWSSPPSNYSLSSVLRERGGISSLASPTLYLQMAANLIPFGIGVIGMLGLLAVPLASKKNGQMKPTVRWAILVSNVCYLMLVLCKIPEPQYFLPPLAWLVVAASPGLDYLLMKLRSGLRWDATLATVFLLHVGLAAVFTSDLKASRVPNFADIENAARLLPPEARVVVVYRYYGASAAVWLNHNVFAVGSAEALDSKLPQLEALGFTYICLLDTETRHNFKPGELTHSLAAAARLFRISATSTFATAARLANYSDPASPVRRYCDQRFLRLFEKPHVVLYSLPSAPPPP